MSEDVNDCQATASDEDSSISHLKSDGETGEMPEEDELQARGPEKGSMTWWFSADEPWQYSRRSPFRKLMIGLVLVVCLAFMVNQTLCAGGPL
jgi:hypothetical protein